MTLNTIIYIIKHTKNYNPSLTYVHNHECQTGMKKMIKQHKSKTMNTRNNITSLLHFKFTSFRTQLMRIWLINTLPHSFFIIAENSVTYQLVHLITIFKVNFNYVMFLFSIIRFCVFLVSSVEVESTPKVYFILLFCNLSLKDYVQHFWRGKIMNEIHCLLHLRANSRQTYLPPQTKVSVQQLLLTLSPTIGGAARIIRLRKNAVICNAM